MSLRDYTARRSNFTQYGGSCQELDPFTTFNKQHPSMMYRGAKISAELDRPMSPRCGSRSARTPLLTPDDCPGLTDIKDVRVHNNLLEEIFNVEDSIELDYFELERQDANFDSYLSGYNSPTSLRLLSNQKQEDYWPGKGYLLNQNASQIPALKIEDVGLRRGLSVARPGPCEPNGSELIAVASPTISSTCEVGQMSSVPGGISNVQSDSPAVNETTSVHSTTANDVVSPNEMTLTAGDKLAQSYGDVQSQTVVPISVQAAAMRSNVRPRPESRFHRGNASQQKCVDGFLQKVEISSDLGIPAEPIMNGDSTTASSSSTTSPSQLHVTKRQRVIDCGSDLLAEVRQAYEFVQGADLYAPSSHPTFAHVESSLTSNCPPVVVKTMQPPPATMNFNFGHNDARPVLFVGSPLVDERARGNPVNLPYPRSPCVGGRRTASPDVVHQSCPDLASPGRPQPHGAAGCYVRPLPLRPFPDEIGTSLSAPTTPSKRAGPSSAANQQFAAPMSPSLALQRHLRPSGPGYRDHPIPVNTGCQEVFMTNNGGNRFVPAASNIPRTSYQESYDPRVEQYSRPQSPRIGPIGNTRGFQPIPDHGSNRYFDAPGNMHSVDMPISKRAVANHGEGIPLSQNAFLRSVVDDEGSVFRSHPLFPLLRDIIIADMNFHTPSFPFQLIANLPADFSRLVQNYVQRNPHLASVTVNDRHTQTVVMDALAYAHAALIGKIEARKLKESASDCSRTSVSVAAGIEDFCETFERSVRPVVDEYRPGMSGDGSKSQFTQLINAPASHTNPRLGPSLHCNSTTDLSYTPDLAPPTRPAHLTHSQYMTNSLPSSPHKLRPLYNQNAIGCGSFTPDLMGTSFEKTNRSKVLPKEAVALMTEWLRQHQDNPYPNDDEKESLIASTRLTMNQINYWFTNARRRILPKWSLQRQIEEQDRKERDVIVL